MAVFQGVNPHGLDQSRMALLQKLQGQMMMRQQQAKRTRALPNPGAHSSGAAMGRPLGIGQQRGSLGRLGITQTSGIAQGILARLGATNPRALEGEYSSAPGMTAGGYGGGLQQPGQAGGPDGPAAANAPGYGGMQPAGIDPASLAGMGGGGDMPQGGAPAPNTTQTGTSPFATGAFSYQPTSPGSDQMQPQPNDIESASGLVNLGGGRFFDPATGAIRGMGNVNPGGGARFLR